jgi:hypothetical protein
MRLRRGRRADGNVSAEVIAMRKQLASLTFLLLVTAACAGRTTLKTPTGQAAIDVAQLWMDPADLESRNLFDGPGGAARAPDASVVYELVKVDTTGYSPGYDVRDPMGTEWSVKLGPEAQTELAASRILWAIGYHQPAVYAVSSWRLAGKEASGPQELARFRPTTANEKVVGEWEWYENPFVMTRQFRGLVVVNQLLNNWDLKTSNNKIYDVLNADGTGRRFYVVRDLGASLGKTTFPTFLARTPLRGMKQGSRNDVEGFEEQGFIQGVEGTRVKFHYRGAHEALLNQLTPADVVWACRLLSRLSDQQWDDAFRAAGYDESVRRRYVAKLKSKVQEGLALAGVATE